MADSARIHGSIGPNDFDYGLTIKCEQIRKHK